MQRPAQIQREVPATTDPDDRARGIDPPLGEEQRLFRCWSKGDNKAGSRLLDRLRRTLVRHFRRRAPGQAEDLAHETLVAFVSARHQLREDAALVGFVHRIADRTFVRLVLRRSRPIETFDEEHVGPGVAPFALSTTVPSVVPQVEAARLLGQAARYTETLVEYYIDGRSAPEIAQARSVDVRRVRNQIRNGLAAMRRSAGLSDHCR